MNTNNGIFIEVLYVTHFYTDSNNWKYLIMYRLYFYNLYSYNSVKTKYESPQGSYP